MKFDGLSTGYRRALWAVIAINAAMFAVEIGAGALSGSVALAADSLDFLADSLTYGLSLWVIGRPLVWRSRAALFKGLSLAVMGVGVFVATIWQTFVLGVPEAFVMSGVGALALAANVVSVVILFRWRDGDANVRSVWLCSRNDAIGNVAVVGAGVAVWLTASGWPDVIVAGAMALLFLRSAAAILRQSLEELRQDRTGVVPLAGE
ncbi:MAG: cation transporter [Thalassobaculum sp.]|uniref:cation transporter n=1 Tax=Thalassobaculum sp. TaxID=2022740 RepID=UPI0032EFF2A5